MGCRLEDGMPIQHVSSPDIVSDALCKGAVQVPGHGMPIVMLADRQTTGGYAKIATVIGVDWWKFAQVLPGNKIRFVQVSDEEAQAIFHERRAVFGKIKEFSARAPLVNMAKEMCGRFNLKINNINYDVEIM